MSLRRHHRERRIHRVERHVPRVGAAADRCPSSDMATSSTSAVRDRPAPTICPGNRQDRARGPEGRSRDRVPGDLRPWADLLWHPEDGRSSDGRAQDEADDDCRSRNRGGGPGAGSEHGRAGLRPGEDRPSEPIGMGAHVVRPRRADASRRPARERPASAKGELDVNGPWCARTSPHPRCSRPIDLLEARSVTGSSDSPITRRRSTSDSAAGMSTSGITVIGRVASVVLPTPGR